MGAGAGDIVLGQPSGKDFLGFGFGVAENCGRVAQEIQIVFFLSLAVKGRIQKQVANDNDVDSADFFSLGECDTCTVVGGAVGTCSTAQSFSIDNSKSFFSKHWYQSFPLMNLL